ncbi:MAG: PEP-CTERM sorting domain-containing protein [Planctomycetaceae bacterium]
MRLDARDHLLGLFDEGIGFRLAAAPVPEPSTYAMALAGLACGGFSMWRRRKHP